MFRELFNGGVIYSEVAFMQQVWEGSCVFSDANGAALLPKPLLDFLCFVLNISIIYSRSDRRQLT
jgi:hypothetical protein